MGTDMQRANPKHRFPSLSDNETNNTTASDAGSISHASITSATSSITTSDTSCATPSVTSSIDTKEDGGPAHKRFKQLYDGLLMLEPPSDAKADAANKPVFPDDEDEGKPLPPLPSRKD
ncbi:hypothetical protein BAUCODRAFT_147612 [Baudoinia panamericana UAMH 10762]|uniref:Uncharacterized protein n=1 Tax=Baudoinia panamericana (strain UAMH 10762) TaxID=717646 RepID=M2LST5_BAUPA|nr:uncharacterized protein BAUCODRAFT_147612 [Baudoinia panamericana UAMH 10762]EMC97547.1 hypothetical protein BAUCODRAFT_147612 [Baudoinia panamericana UAMH 10762]